MYISDRGKIMRKLLGKQQVESSLDHTAGPTASITSSPLPSSSSATAAYRPSASQNVDFPAGVPIAALDRSPDGRSAVLAGRHILKTVTFDGLSVKEGLDVRALIQTQSASKTSTTAASAADQLSIYDVKWASGQSESLFTACTNGKIFQYNLGRLSQGGTSTGTLEFIQMREDSRQVTTLDINPHRGTYLLSGSHDGIVRCFDIRQPVSTRAGQSFRAVQSFKCNADSVRHVKWSPRDGFSFACATEQGVILKWDIRKANAPLLKINAHDKACTSVAWHMDGDHLISAGMDSRCKVWDVSKTADKRQKPKWSISTPAPVAAVCWRPGQWSATAQGRRAAQVAVSYEERGGQKRFAAVHVWDLARPTMPFKEIERFESSPAAMLWCDPDLLWTVGQDGLFSQCDVAFAPKVLDRLSMSSMAFSARGEVAMFLDERPPSRRPRYSVVHGERPPTSSYGSSPSTPMLSISRSDSEDDVLASFLGPRRRTGRKRRPSTRSTTNLSSTPPSGVPGEDIVVPLEQSVKMAGTFKTQQAMAIGPVPSAAKTHIYHYLSTIYLETLLSELPYRRGGPNLPKRLADILDHYAMAAENVGQFRLAQTWRVLAYAMDMLLRTRAQYHLEKRLRQGRRGSPDLRHWNGDGHSDHDDDHPQAALPTDPHAFHLRSLLSEELESTSNMPTPVARPVKDELTEELRQAAGIDAKWHGHGQKLSPVAEGGSFTLPPAVFPRPGGERQRLDSEPVSEKSHTSGHTLASTEGYDFYDMDHLAETVAAVPIAIDVPQSKKPKPVQAVDFVEPASPERARRPIARHNSDDSYAQMFSISQTSGNSTSSAGSQPKRIPRSQPVDERELLTAASSDGEYANRVRGNQIRSSPVSQGLLRKALERGESQLTTTTTTTTDDEDYRLTTQTTSDSFQSQEYAYSGDSPRDLPHAAHSSLHHSSGSQSPTHDSIIETDYLPQPHDAPYPFPTTPSTLHPSSPVQTRSPPLNPYTMLRRALAFETRTSALNAEAIILLLAPLVPDDVVDPHQAAAILAQYHRRLMGMRCFVEAAMLRNLCQKGWPGGVLSSWGRDYENVSGQATRGVAVGRMCGQCGKPWEGDGRWRCPRCESVMGPCAVCGHRESSVNAVSLNQGLDAHLADEDSHSQDHADPALLTTWWYCPGCGHGGHSTCLEAWHSPLPGSTTAASPLVGTPGTENAPPSPSPGMHLPGADADGGSMFSDGCCPLDGCGHACLPGRWRAEAVAARSEELTRVVRDAARQRSGRGSPVLGAIGGGIGMGIQMGSGGDRRTSGEIIRGDGYEVGQSRAVESVRESLASDSTGGRDIGSSAGSRGILGTSPGRAGGFGEGRDRERRKSVKFVPGDRG